MTILHQSFPLRSLIHQTSLPQPDFAHLRRYIDRPIFIIAFMRLEAREPWPLTLIMAAGMTTFVYVVFDRLLQLGWPQTVLGNLFPILQNVPSM